MNEVATMIPEIIIDKRTLNDLWKAILSPDGKTYCAPACGGRCSKANFDKATACAESLAKLCGPGWEPNVWENLGWHYSAVKVGAEMIGYPDRADKYGPPVSFWLNIHPTPESAQIIGEGDTAEAAMNDAIHKIAAMVRRIMEVGSIFMGESIETFNAQLESRLALPVAVEAGDS